MENYIIDVPPMEFESFDSMNSKQAQEFFDWYVGNTGKKVKTLFEYISKTGNNKIQADFRKQSLIDVWGWFECNITTEFMNFKEMLENIRGNKISFLRLFLILKNYIFNICNRYGYCDIFCGNIYI